MAEMLLTIEHEGTLFTPPVKDDIKIEWERTGSPGKLTFTTLKVDNMDFTEGDAVCFYYDDKKIFMGYVFEKKRDKKQQIQVVCYDQLRYLKNKYTYVFENKTATQIIQALCKDYNLKTGTMINTQYVLPSVVEENIAALDIILEVLEDTLLNTGDMYTLYDDFGELTLKNVENMVSETLIMEDTAKDFNYASSIDKETYNSIVLYYKPESSKSTSSTIQVFSSYNVDKINKWGTLRYFESIKNPSIGATKVKQLLNLYCRKTRELKVSGAFGDTTVRGGTLIPVKLNLGDTIVNNYMLVTKVIHNFNNELHTMDLTLEGAWDDTIDGDTIVSNQFGVNVPTTTTPTTSNNNNNNYPSSVPVSKPETKPVSVSKTVTLSINFMGTTHTSAAGREHGGGGASRDHGGGGASRATTNTNEGPNLIQITYYNENNKRITVTTSVNIKLEAYRGTSIKFSIVARNGYSSRIETSDNRWTGSKSLYQGVADDDLSIYVRWVK